MRDIFLISGKTILVKEVANHKSLRENSLWSLSPKLPLFKKNVPCVLPPTFIKNKPKNTKEKFTRYHGCAIRRQFCALLRVHKIRVHIIYIDIDM